MATGPKGITNAALKRALRKHGGVYLLAAQELGCDRSNVAHRVARSPDLQKLLADIEEEFGDLAEGVIKSTMTIRENGKPTKAAQGMAKWYADRKLRDRGFVTRSEVTGKDGAPLPSGPNVRIVLEYADPKPEGEVGEVI
jgi:hypothetical protein